MPSVFLEFPLATLFIIVVGVMVLMSILSPKRPQGPQRRFDGTGTRRCSSCGTDHPVFAVYCRKCGRRL